MKYVFIGFTSIIVCLGAVLFFSQKRNEQLNQENRGLEIAVTNYTNQIQRLVEKHNKADQQIFELTRRIQEIEVESSKAKERLDETLRTRNLEEIARRKATLMERLINKASNEVMENFENLSNPDVVWTNRIELNTRSLEAR